MLDGRIKGDGTERFSPPPVVAGEIVLVDQHPATDDNNGMGARLPPSLEVRADSAKDGSVNPLLLRCSDRPTIAKLSGCDVAAHGDSYSSRPYPGLLR
jgi:hypothetical protein